VTSAGPTPARARVLDDGRMAWNARWDLLARAQRSVDAVYFIVERDVFGFAFLGHLLKKQRAGIPVRLMFDAMADTFGARGFKSHLSLKPLGLGGKDYVQELAEAGAEVAVYHPLWQRPFRLGSESVLACNHDKILVVDGEASITGGTNIARDYYISPDDNPQAWRDTDVILRGEGAAERLSAALTRELVRDNVVQRVRPDLFGNWVKRDLELLGAYCLMDLWLHDPAPTATEAESLRTDSGTRQAVAADLVERALARLPAEGMARAPNDRERKKLTELALELAAYPDMRGSAAAYDASAELHDAQVQILDQTAAVGGRFDEMAAKLVELADSAEHSIVIENPYVVLTEGTLQALERASKRGVEIVIGTNSPLSTDSSVTQAFFLEDWAYVLARLPTARIFVATGQRKLHAKVAVIDDVATIVSTFNMDYLSVRTNSEVGAVIWSKELAARTLEGFRRDYDDPRNGVVEYTIARDEQQRPRLVDGKPVPTYGPEDHLPADVLAAYAKRRKLWSFARRHVPLLAPLRHPPLTAP
jgi:cardiolipin synthase C